MRTLSKFNYGIIFIVLLILSTPHNVTGQMNNNSNITIDAVHGPISINGNADFHAQAITEGWDMGGSRDGSKNSPYVIMSISIVENSVTLVNIKYTDVYFSFTSSYLEGGYRAFSFTNVSNAYIGDNTLVGQSNKAIHLQYSEDIRIINNDISKTNGPVLDGEGITLSYSHRVEISDNSIYNTTNGVEIFGSTNNTIKLNFIYYSSRNGIEFKFDSRNNTVDQNFITDNYNYGISNSNDNIIVNNYIANNRLEGITLLDNNYVYTNSLANNGNAAIRSSYGENNIVSSNSISSKVLGIVLYWGKNNEIILNSITSAGYSIVIDKSENNTINNNTMDSGIFLQGASTESYYNQFEMIGNTVNDLPIYYLKNVRDPSQLNLDSEIGQLFIFNSSSLEIKNKKFGYSAVGLEIAFSNNINISNSTFQNTTYGMRVSFSQDVYFTNNTISNSFRNSINLFYTNKVTITQSKFINNGIFATSIDTIYILYSNNSIINRNYLDGNLGNGITIISGYFNNIYLNSINFGSVGIYSSGYNDVIESNRVENTSKEGIYVQSEGSIVRANQIINSSKYGIFANSRNGEYHHNTLLRNNNFGIQAYDGNLNNSFVNNYWDDWSGSGSYSVDGPLTNSDPNPLSEPHVFTSYGINHPSINIQEEKVVTIEWNAPVDNLGHVLYYDIQVSTDLALTWMTIATKINQNYYNWETRGYQNSTQYKIRVTASDDKGYLLDAVSSIFSINNVAHYLSTPTINNLLSSNVSSIGHIVYWTTSVDTWELDVHYNVYDSINNNSWQLLGRVENDNAFYWNTTNYGLKSTVYFKVVAVSSSGLMSEDIFVGTIVEATILSTITIIVDNSTTTVVHETETITLTSTSSLISTISNTDSTPGYSIMIAIMAVAIISRVRGLLCIINKYKKH